MENLFLSFKDNFSRAVAAPGRHIPPMSDWSTRLAQRIKALGWKLPEAAKRCDVDYHSLKKYVKGGVEQPRGDTLAKLARGTGVNLQWLRDGTGPEYSRIPVVGYASGGEEWLPADDVSESAGLSTVEFDFSAADPIAIRVRGMSMAPVYRAGDVLICSRKRGMERADILRRDCVVRTTDGRCFIKQVLPGENENTFRLRSYDPHYADIDGVHLDWAAPVLWIRRDH